MAFFIGIFFLFHVFFLYITQVHIFNELFLENEKSSARILREKNIKSGNVFNKTFESLAKSFSFNDPYFVKSWRKKKRRKNYIVRKHICCTIIPIFHSKNKNGNGKKNEVNENKTPVINNIENDNTKEEKKGGQQKEQVPFQNELIRKENPSENIELPKSNNEKNHYSNKKGKNNHILHLENNYNRDYEKEENEAIQFFDMNVNSSKLLKNLHDYEKHLEVIKEKTIIAFDKLFCNYTKSLDKKENLKTFFEKLMITFEEQFQQYSLIKNISQLQNVKIKNEYLLKNVSYFKELINIMEQHFLNMLLFKIQLLKIKAINELKNYISCGTGKDNNLNYLNKVNQIIKKYIKDIYDLMPPDHKFSLYKEFETNDIFVTDFSCYFSANKYKKLIEQNIQDLKQFAQDVTKKNKFTLREEMEKNKNYQNILQIIDNQQKQIELLQEQLETSVEGRNGKYTPLHWALSYRVPDTNLNISTQYSRGKVNIKLNCIPDDSLHLLGSYGFVKSLPFGNLGLSLSLNF